MSPSPSEELRSAASTLNGPPEGWIEWVHPDLRGPLAGLLEEVADEAVKHAKGLGNSEDEIATGWPLSVARVINGGGAR